MQEFSKPLEIIQCKLGDTLLFSCEDETPYDLVINTYDIDGDLLQGPFYPVDDGVMVYWDITANATYGLSSAKEYYLVEIADNETSDYIEKRYIVYVNDDLNMENYITRCLGLSGHNLRQYDYIWTRGLLTSFSLKFYATTSALNAAELGTSDDYIAHYIVTISYDNNYNPYQITSVRQS